MSTGECSVCFEQVALVKLSDCEHAADICLECFRKNSSETMRGKSQTAIRCATTTCNKPATDADLRRLLTKPDYDLYDDMLLRECIRKDKFFTWCKKPNCGSGQIHEDGKDAPIVTCGFCKERHCFTCQVPWHNGLTCTQFEEKKKTDEDAATNSFLQRNCKPCPKCHANINKDDGCDHMTCRSPGCTHQFCWLCLAPYAPIVARGGGNHLHRESCQHYRAIEPVN